MDARQYARAARSVSDVARRRAARRAHRVRDLGDAQRSARQRACCCSPDCRRPRMRRPRPRTRARAGGRDDRARAAIDTEPLLRHLRELTRQLFRLERSGVDRSCDRCALPARLSRICRSKTSRAPASRPLRALGIEPLDTVDGPLARRHGGARVSRRCSRVRRAAWSASRAPRPPRRLPSRCAPSSARPSFRPGLEGGAYDAEHPPVTGMRLARKLGTMTYRSAAEWQQRFGREPIRPDMKVSRSRSQPSSRCRDISRRSRSASSARFDANCYLYISRAMDRFDLAAHGGRWRCFAARVSTHALVIGVQSDLLFAVREQRRGRGLAQVSRCCDALRTSAVHRRARRIPG